MSRTTMRAGPRAQPEADDLAREGDALFVALGCSGCHAPSSQVHAPELAGLYRPPGASRGRPHRAPPTRPICAIRSCCRSRTSSPATSRSCRASPAWSTRTTCSELMAYLKSLRDAAARPERTMSDDRLRPCSLHHRGRARKLSLRRPYAASWLSTTDHKRIAHPLRARRSPSSSSSAASPAALIRLELFTPHGDLLTDDGYNRLFTLHGIVMVWFFLVPSIPTTLGNFLLPLMIGATDVAFPRLNLLSWYLFMIGGDFCDLRASSPAASIRAGPSTRRYSTAVLQQQCPGRRGSAVFIAGFSSHRHRRELHRHHPHAARAGHDLVPPAAVRLGDLRDEPGDGAGDAGAGDDAAADHGRALASACRSSTRRMAATRCCSSTCSGSTATRPSTS